MEADARVSMLVPAHPDTVYAHLAALDLYPNWMRDVHHVTRTGPRRRRWGLAGPQGRLEWDIEVTVQQPGDRFGFAIEGPDVLGYMFCRLARSGGTTGLLAQLSLDVTGPLADRFEPWWGDPTARLRRDLSNLKAALRPRAVQTSSDLTSSLSGPSRASLFSSW